MVKQELGEKYNQSVSLGTEEQLVQGKDILTKYCLTCHGSSGKDDGPGATTLQPKPADFTDSEHSSFYSNQGRIYLIKKRNERNCNGSMGKHFERRRNPFYLYM